MINNNINDKDENKYKDKIQNKNNAKWKINSKDDCIFSILYNVYVAKVLLF